MMLAEIKAGEPGSLLEPLRELQDRIRLEIPEEHSKHEEIREAADRQTAGLTLTWYSKANGEPDGADLDAEPIIERLVDDVLGEEPVAWEVSTKTQSLYVSETQVKVRWEEGYVPQEREAAVPPDASVDPYGLQVLLGEGRYRIVTEHGTEWGIERGDEIVEEELPSAATALGTLVGHLLSGVADIGTGLGDPGAADQADRDFIEGIAPVLANSPIVSEEALEHLVSFVEMATGREFDPDAD